MQRNEKTRKVERTVVMNRKTVVKIPTLILVLTLFISVMTGCGMKETESTETSTKTEIEADAIQPSDSSAINKINITENT